MYTVTFSSGESVAYFFKNYKDRDYFHDFFESSGHPLTLILHYRMANTNEFNNVFLTSSTLDEFNSSSFRWSKIIAQIYQGNVLEDEVFN